MFLTSGKELIQDKQNYVSTCTQVNKWSTPFRLTDEKCRETGGYRRMPGGQCGLESGFLVGGREPPP